MGDLGPWSVAAVAGDKARDLLEPGVEPVLRKEVEDLAAELAVERQQAETVARAAERDRTLLDRLVDIRSAEADDQGGSSTDAAYADAFREAGLDAAALPAEDVARQILARPPAVAATLTAAVDDWAAIRRDRQKDRPARRHCRPWPARPTPIHGASACVKPWTCPTGPRAWRHFDVWPRPRRSRRWVR